MGRVVRWGAGRDPAGSFDDVLDERADQAGSSRGAGGGAEQVDGALVAQEAFRVEVLAGAGETASRTLGSAKAENAMVTMAHTESRCRGSAMTIDSSAWCHDGAASAWVLRIMTASRAWTADSDQR